MNDLNNKQITIFIATSITRKLGRPAEIARLRLLVDTIDGAARANGAKTVCAFREEGWKGEDDPAVFVPRDFRWCVECDGAVVFPEDSYGVRVELGWLSALQKPILRLHEGRIRHQTGLEKYLHRVCTIIDRAITNPDDLAETTSRFIESIRGGQSLRDFSQNG